MLLDVALCAENEMGAVKEFGHVYSCGKAHSGCCLLEVGDEMGVVRCGIGGPRIIVIRLLW